MAPVPIVLFDKKFWGKWDDFVRENMLPNKLISDGDEKIYTITEDIPEVVNLIKISELVATDSLFLRLRLNPTNSTLADHSLYGWIVRARVVFYIGA